MNILKSPYAYFLATRIRQRHIESNIRCAEGDMLLDAGCGVGYYTFLLSQDNVRVFGMDIDQPALNSAKSNGRGVFICADITAIPFKEKTFNRALICETLEHLPDESPALKEIKRVCARGGEILITVPCSEGLLSRSPLRMLGHDKPGVEFHYRDGYTREGFRKILSNSGFLILKMYSCDGIFSELIIQLSKFLYLRKKKYFLSQNDIAAFPHAGAAFSLYKYLIFPLIYFISICEDIFLCRFFCGHTIIAKVINEV